MAYCVMCGVKLSEGSTSCPLCNTKVVLPDGVVERRSDSLFAQPLVTDSAVALTKWRKGIIELILSLFVVSEIAIALSLWLSGLARYSYIPLFSIAGVSVYLVVALLSPFTYRRQTTLLLGATALFLVGLDASDLVLSWSMIAAPALILLWLVAVYPLNTPSLIRYSVVLVVAVGAYLAHINLWLGHTLTWFFPVAIPTMISIVVLSGLCVLLYLKRKRASTVVEILFSSLVVIFISLTTFDLSLSVYLTKAFTLRWSQSLLYAALVILIFLVSLSCSRRLRRYFTSKSH